MFHHSGEPARVEVPGATGIHPWPLQVALGPNYFVLEARFIFQVSWLVTSGWGKSSFGWATAEGPPPKIWQGWQRLQLVFIRWDLFNHFNNAVFSVGWVRQKNQQWICLFSLTLGRLTGAQVLLAYPSCNFLPSSSLVVFFDFEHNKNEPEGKGIKTCDRKPWILGPCYWLP